MMRQSAYSNLVAESRFDTLDSPRDRAFASTLFYGVLERQITLRRIVASYCRKPVDKLDPEVLCALEMGLYQLLFLDSVPERAAVNESVLLTRKLGKQSASGFVNGVLRAFIRDGKPLCPGAEKLSPLERLSAEASAPEELCRLLMEHSARDGSMCRISPASSAARHWMSVRACGCWTPVRPPAARPSPWRNRWRIRAKWWPATSILPGWV